MASARETSPGAHREWARLAASPAETEEVGARIAAGLVPGDVVLVSGELGAGKTTLIRGACRALGVKEAISSPTFTIGRRYRGRVPVSHLDLYRLQGLDDEDPGLLDDYLTDDAVAFVEWPLAAERPQMGSARETSPRRPSGTGAAGFEPHLERIAMRVELTHDGGDNRLIAMRRS